MSNNSENKVQTSLPSVVRMKSFARPSVNPFIHEINLTLAKKIQIFIMSFTVAPLRIILALIVVIAGWFIAFLSTIGMDLDRKTPVGALRRQMFQLQYWIGHIYFHILGFTMEVKGKRADIKEARVLTVAPHSSFYDVAVFFSTIPMPGGVSRTDNAAVPIIGTLLKTIQPVLVSRHDPLSRQNTIKEIERRAGSSDKWPQIVIFPEGTCTNRKALITFKAGAFIPGVPIQPVLLRYPNTLDTCTWTMNGPGAFKLLWYSLCQFYIRLQIEYLPVYYPNQAEIADPKLYAENVRKIMSEELGVTCTDHTFEDCRLMYDAESLNLPMEAGLVEFSKLNRKLGTDIDKMKELLTEYANICKSCQDGAIRIEEFAKHLKLPITKQLEELFSMYDRNGSGVIDFREYVIGMSLISQAAVTEKTVKLAFKVFDLDVDGLISREELDHVLKLVFGPEVDGHTIYDQIDVDGKGKIDYDQFYAFAQKRPEYAKLFVSYQELEQDNIAEIKANLMRLRSNAVGNTRVEQNSAVLRKPQSDPQHESMPSTSDVIQSNRSKTE